MWNKRHGYALFVCKDVYYCVLMCSFKIFPCVYLELTIRYEEATGLQQPKINFWPGKFTKWYFF